MICPSAVIVFKQSARSTARSKEWIDVGFGADVEEATADDS